MATGHSDRASGCCRMAVCRAIRTLPPTEPGEAARNAADLSAYLMPPENTWLGQQWLAQLGSGPRWIWGEQTVSIGWIALAVAALGVWALARQKQWRLLLVFATLTVPLSSCLWVLQSGRPRLVDPVLGVQRTAGLDAFRAPALRGSRPLGFAVFVAVGSHGSYGRAFIRPVAILLPLMLSEWYIMVPVDYPKPSKCRRSTE